MKPVLGMQAGPWCAALFITPKEDGHVRFITDFRKLNPEIVCKPWPMLHIADLIQRLVPTSMLPPLIIQWAMIT